VVTERYRVKIKGIRPILFNRFYEVEKTKKRGARRDPKEEARLSLYLDKEKNICTPSIHIEGALIKAAADYKMPGKGRKTFKDAVRSGLIVEPELIVHKNQEWVVDRRPAVVQRSRIMRSRARLDDWELEFNILVFDERITKSILREFLETAGRYMGLGYYRPKFGLFKIMEFEKVE